MKPIPESVIRWLADGERGVSSNTMVARLFGLPCEHRGHPHDPDDLRRCFALCEACPEVDLRLSEMPRESVEWAALVSHWVELKLAFEREFPTWRSACGPTKGDGSTYTLMQKLFKDAGLTSFKQRLAELAGCAAYLKLSQTHAVLLAAISHLEAGGR